MAQHPAKDNLCLYDKYIDKAPPIENPARTILLSGIPSEISLSISSIIVVHIEFIDSVSSCASIDIL